jgi:protein involved in polysaccharide export with SLBB domain
LLRLRCYIMLAWLAFLSVGYSQTRPDEEDTRAKELQLQREVLKYQELESRLLEEAYEAGIDPNNYIVGPGDLFSIYIGGNVQLNYKSGVTAEGLLIIPTVGIQMVSGLTLAEVQESVRNQILRKYRQTEINAYLVGMRRIRVHVTGRILNPGTYVATPIDRLSDLIARAGGLGVYADHRSVLIRHLDNTEDTYDFSAYHFKGDLSQNPFVTGGDVIIIPPIDYANRVALVEGFVGRPGYYPIKESETVLSFLNRHSLINYAQEIRDVEIRRANGQTTMVDLTTSVASETQIQSGDTIVLPQAVRQVYVLGAVRNPGQFRYMVNFRARDYAGEAGLTEDAAGINKLRVRHTKTGKTEVGGDVRVLPGDVIEAPIRSGKKITEYLQIASQLATIVIAYYAIK